METSKIESGMGDIKDEKTESSCRLPEDSTKVEHEFAEYLEGLRLPLDNGTTTGCVVEQSRHNQSGQMVYACRPCAVTLYGQWMVQTHVRGKRHLSKLGSRQSWPEFIQTNLVLTAVDNVDTATLSPAPNKTFLEEFNFDLSIVCDIQTHLDSFRSKSIIGLEYLVEILSIDDEGILYNCVLCNKNACFDRMLQTHLVSSEHVLQYMSIHFNTAYSAIKENKLECDASVKQAIADRLSQAIEYSYGRLRPVQCTEEQWNTHRTAICRTVARREHFSERFGKTFAEMVSVKAAQRLHEDKKPGNSSADNKAITFKTVGKRQHFTDTLIKGFVPIVAVKPLQDSRRDQNIGAAIHDGNNAAEEQTTEVVSAPDYVSSREKKEDNASERSHSQYGNSPVRQDKRTTSTISPEERKKLFDKVKTYVERTQQELDDALKVMSVHEKNPEKHPDYPSEWVLFWNRRFMEIRAENKDTMTHDFKSEWIKYWPKRLVHLQNARIESIKKALRKELGFPENKSPTRDLLLQLPAVNPRSSSPSPQRRSRILTRLSPSQTNLYASRRIESRSPRRRSPRQRSRSPMKHSRSPRRRTRSPIRRTRSPRRRSRSPRRQTRSPGKQSPSARKHSRLPRKQSRSPRRRTRSPRSRTRSPKKQSRSPRRRSRSPRRQSLSPKRSLRRSCSPILRRRPRSPLQRRLSPCKRITATESDCRKQQSRSPIPENRTQSPFPCQAKSRELSEVYEAKDTSKIISQVDIQSLDDSLTSKLQDDVRELNFQSNVESDRHSEELRRPNFKSLHRLDSVGELQSMCRTQNISKLDSDAKCEQNNRADNAECDDSSSSCSISTISTIGSSLCSPVPTTQKDPQRPRDIVPVLRLLAALEDYLGPSLGPGVLKVLAEALKMEKEKPSSSWNILQVETHLTLLEMCKEKLRGKMEVGLVKTAALSASLEAIIRTTALLQRADDWKRKRQKEAEMKRDPVNSLDKLTLLRHLEEALLRRGKTDLSTDELATLVDSVLDVEKTRKHVPEKTQLSHIEADIIQPETIMKINGLMTGENFEATIVQEADNSESKTDLKDLSPIQEVDEGMDGLSDSELRTLIKNYRHLSQDERQRLSSYVNMLEVRNPERMARLRRIMRFGILQKTELDIDVHSNTKVASKSAVEVKNYLKQNDIENTDLNMKGSEIEECENTPSTQKRIKEADKKHLHQKEIEDPKRPKRNKVQSDTTSSSQVRTATVESHHHTETENCSLQQELENEMPRKKDQETINLLLPQQKQEEAKSIQAERSAFPLQQMKIADNTWPECRKKKLENHKIAEDDSVSQMKKQKTEFMPKRRISLEDYFLTQRNKNKSTMLSKEEEQKPAHSRLSQDKEMKPENSQQSQNQDIKLKSLHMSQNKEHKPRNSRLLQNEEKKLQNSWLSRNKEEPTNTKFSEKEQKTEYKNLQQKPENKCLPEEKINIENKNLHRNNEFKNAKPVNMLRNKEQKPENMQLLHRKTKNLKMDSLTEQKKVEPEKCQKLEKLPSVQNLEHKFENTPLPHHKKRAFGEKTTQGKLKQLKNIGNNAFAKQNNGDSDNLLNEELNLDKNRLKNVMLTQQKGKVEENVVLPQQKKNEMKNVVPTQHKKNVTENVVSTQQKEKSTDNVVSTQQKEKRTEKLVSTLQIKKKTMNESIQKNKKEADNVVLPQKNKKASENVVLPQPINKEADIVVLSQQNKKKADNVVLSQQNNMEANNVVLPQKNKKAAENFVLPQPINKEADNVVLSQPNKKEADNVVLSQQNKKEAENVLLLQQNKKKADNVVLPHKNKKAAENVVSPTPINKEADNKVLPQQNNMKAKNLVLPQKNTKAPQNVVMSQPINKQADNVVLLPKNKKAAENVILPQPTNQQADNVVLSQQNKKKAKNVVLSQQNKKEAESIVLPQQNKKKADNVVLSQQNKKKEKNVVLPQQNKKEADNVVLLQKNKMAAENVILPQPINQQADNVVLYQQNKKKGDNLVLPQQNKTEAENVVLPDLNKKEAENVVFSQEKKKKAVKTLCNKKENIFSQQVKEVAKFALLPFLKMQEPNSVLLKQIEEKPKILPEQIKQNSETLVLEVPESFRKADGTQRTKQCEIETSLSKASTQKIPATKKQGSNKVTASVSARKLQTKVNPKTPHTSSLTKHAKTVATPNKTNSACFTRKTPTDCAQIADGAPPAKKAKPNFAMTARQRLKEKAVQKESGFKYNLHIQKNWPESQQQNCEMRMTYPNEQVYHCSESSEWGNRFQLPFSQQRMSFQRKTQYSENDFRESNQYSQEKFYEELPLQRDCFPRERFPNKQIFDYRKQFSRGGFNKRPSLPERNFEQRSFEEPHQYFSRPENFHRTPDQIPEPEVLIRFHGQYDQGPRFSNIHYFRDFF